MTAPLIAILPARANPELKLWVEAALGTREDCYRWSPDVIDSLRHSMLRFLRDESGPTAVEYCVMLMLILLVCITAVQLVGRALNDSWTDSSGRLNEALN